MPLVVVEIAVLVLHHRRVVAQRRQVILRGADGPRVGVRGLHLPPAAEPLGQLHLDPGVARVIEITHHEDLVEEGALDEQIGPPVGDRKFMKIRPQDIEQPAVVPETERVVDLPVLQLVAVAPVDVSDLQRHLGSELPLEPECHLIGERGLQTAIDLRHARRVGRDQRPDTVVRHAQ